MPARTLLLLLKLIMVWGVVAGKRDYIFQNNKNLKFGNTLSSCEITAVPEPAVIERGIL